MLRILCAVLLLLCSSVCADAKPRVVPPPQRSDPLAKLAQQIEPDLVGRADRLTQYIELYRVNLANDTRLFAFDVSAEANQAGQVELSGHIEFEETRVGLVGLLNVLGFEVLDEKLKTLPDESLGSKAYGFVKTTHALSYSRPSEPRSVVTDCLLGEPLYLLREEGGHLLVHSGEGYLGYVSADDVHRVDAVAFARYPTESSVRMVENHTLDSGLVIPAGSQLKRLPSKGESITIALPTGETAEIAREKCEDANSSAAAIERAIVAAKQLLGTPYHWGGKTSEGIDCSGLVQVAFATTGVHLPRDSNQQFLLGQLTGTRWHRAGLRRGDTLYFLGSHGRIRHTALYLGDDRFLHAQTPVVTIGSFNPDHDEYDPRRAANFAFGKRLWQ